jgi:hypothetical protein
VNWNGQDCLISDLDSFGKLSGLVVYVYEIGLCRPILELTYLSSSRCEL